jgi:hypothetical protein
MNRHNENAHQSDVLPVSDFAKMPLLIKYGYTRNGMCTLIVTRFMGGTFDNGTYYTSLDWIIVPLLITMERFTGVAPSRVEVEKQLIMELSFASG